LGGHALAAPHFLQRLHEPLARQAHLLKEASGGSAIVEHRQEQMLDRDVVVLEPLRLIFGLD
jgi:hypothetical protein